MNNENEAAALPLKTPGDSGRTHNEEWMLYLLSAAIPGGTALSAYTDSTHVYASDEAHARLRAKTWIALHRHCCYLEVKAYPDGFTLQTRELAGKITVQVKEDCNE